MPLSVLHTILNKSLGVDVSQENWRNDMQITVITPEQAKRLLATFKKPEKANFSSSQVDWKGKFSSNGEYMDKPYVCGGYVKGSDSDVEITIGWEGIGGMEDITPGWMHGYSFPADGVHNWVTACQATKRHLEEIIAS